MNRSAIGFVAVALVAWAQSGRIEQAWQLIAKGNRGQAIAMLRDLLRQEPANVDARLLLGSILMEDGNREESISQLTEAVRLRPNSAEALNALGEAYASFEDPDAARRAFERAISLDPAFAPAHTNLGSVLLQLGKGAEAQPYLNRAIALLGDKAEAAYPLYLLAKVAVARRDPASAIPRLERAVALAPDYAEAWSDLGEARKMAGDDDGALTALRHAVELKPGDTVAQTRLGLTLLNLGQAHEAVVPLQHAAGLDPNNQSTLNALQLALRKDGQKEQADGVKRRLADLLRGRDRADQALVSALELNNKGSVLEKAGDLRGALEKYRDALQLCPDHVGIRTNFAIALLKLGDWSQGLSQLREAARRDPGNSDLQRALADALAQARSHGLVPDK